MMDTTIIPLVLPSKDGYFETQVAVSDIPFAVLAAARFQYLHKNELQYYNTLPAEKRAHSYLLGRYTAKKALGVYWEEPSLWEIEIGYGVFSQPVLYFRCAGNTQVSMAHSGTKAIAVAFPEKLLLGVDVEMINPDSNWGHLMPLTDQERSTATQLNYPHHQVLTAYWCMKEALSKAVKLGFTVDLRMYELAACLQADGYLEGRFTFFTSFKAYAWFAAGACWSVVLPGNITTDLRLLRSLMGI